VDIGAHVFPTTKYHLVCDRLIQTGLFSNDDFVEPTPASDEDVLLVHTSEYLRKLKTGTLSDWEIMRLEVPYSKELVESSFLCVQGSILTGRFALEDGASAHLGGGFHHAFPDHGEGFCVLNDHSIAIRRLQKDRAIKKALVVDCDLHQGNGTAFIFAGDPTVFTFSIHQENNYPAVKPPSDLDIRLRDGAGDEEYLNHLRHHIPRIIGDFKPDLLFYVAGADPYENDQLGGLALTLEGLKARDELVIDEAVKAGVPVAVVLAGGYAFKLEDTVTIHASTVRVARDIIKNS
jgi:acetoin utilization deacetylase AcuC-like enzyme